MPPHLLRRTAVGALAGALLFGVVPVVRLLLAGESLRGLVQPVLWIACLGATVGGLAGPLVGQAWARFASRGNGPTRPRPGAPGSGPG